MMTRVLALAILVAQFGVEIHVYSHPLGDPLDQPGVARNCGFCLASSQLQVAIGASPQQLPARAVAWVTVVADSSAPRPDSRHFRAFRSRAPPALV
jgi:hypothetical protein